MLPPVVPDLVPVHVPPKLASFKVTLLGNVSTNALLNVAKLALLLLNVIVSTLVPLGAIDAGLKLLDTVGATGAGSTTRHWLVDVFVNPVTVTEDARFVNAEGFPMQLLLAWPLAFVRPATVTLQLDVPDVIAMPVRPDNTKLL